MPYNVRTVAAGLLSNALIHNPILDSFSIWRIEFSECDIIGGESHWPKGQIDLE